MTALPMNELQKTLDIAAKRWPESTTLGDFRAEAWLVEAETAALQHAKRIITPHAYIASLFRSRADLLSWKVPESELRPAPNNPKPVIVFPASTVGRKGCYELREGIRDLDVKLLTLGPYIESADFWRGFDVERAGEDWLDLADLVALPAHVEHRPRRLLSAASRGIPVIATPNCGLPESDGVYLTPAGDAKALRQEISQFIESRDK